VHEVVGADVRDRAGTPLGTVVAVQANPAHDLLVLDGGALVPMVFVVEHGEGVVVIDAPDGLFDL
jgi:16S rRNA processing protein RimM